MKSLKRPWVRVLYLYLFCFVGLLVVVVGGIRLVDLGLKVWVFNGADRYYYTKPQVVGEDKVSTQEASIGDREAALNQEVESNRQRQREFSSAISMVIIGMPLYLYHWSLIRRENS